ncbi:hypothetical protein BD410DRAFT_828788 [Rickenella mellea]|uniref:F-box domain-containing protein n=1 Tax=Rickenella mellea TaxID=50990 RepID=A0A4Y7Q2D9_9AGAM|nr:hypothetical protein BD410DRAFT_828788 [Rickenella mellea]
MSPSLDAKRLRRGTDLGDGVDVRTFQSPIHRIPPEMLAEIFVCCLPESRLPRTHPLEAPLLLSQVSSVFRSTALSTPTLWSGIRIKTVKARREHCLTLGLWISRSGSSPLSFSFRYEKGNNSNVAIDELIRILAPHSRRWKHVGITFFQDYVTSVFIEAVARGIPNLEILTIDPSYDRMAQLCNDRLVLSSAHHLKEINISVLVLIDLGTSLLPSVKRICFRGRNMSYSLGRSLYFLDHCPSIEEFTLNLFGTSGDLGAFGDQVKIRHLPFLRDLNIIATEGHAGPFFDHLCVPSLRKLTFYGHERAGLDPGQGPHQPSWASMIGMFKRSNAPLQELRLDGSCVSEADLVECLQCIPRLKYLEYVDLYRTGMIVKVLELNSPNALCLELEVIVLTSYSLNVSTFVNMVSSRWDGSRSDAGLGKAGGRCLKKIVVEGRHDETIINEPTLAKFVSEGLEMELRVGD